MPNLFALYVGLSIVPTDHSPKDQSKVLTLAKGNAVIMIAIALEYYTITHSRNENLA